MSEPVMAIPAAPPAAAPAAPAANTAPADASEAPANGQFQSALLRQLQGLNSADTALSAVPGALPEVLQAQAGDAKPEAAKADQDGTDVPVPGQGLPLDPSLLLIVPPLAMANAAPSAGGNAMPPRLNLPPVAGTIAAVVAAPGSAPHPAPDLTLAATPPKEAITAHGAALAAELTTPPPAMPVSAEQPTALNSMLTMAAAPTPAAHAPASAVAPISIPVAQPGWEQALGQRVQWVVSQQLQGAELHITPPHLGPIEVRVSIGQDQQTVVNFASPHAAVRDAIEAAVPRLRDMLATNGQDLVNVNVSQHSFAEQRRQAAPSGGARDNSYRGDLSVGAIEATTGPSGAGRAGLGLVDYFA